MEGRGIGTKPWRRVFTRKCLNYYTPYEIILLDNLFIASSKIPTGAFEV